MGWEVVKEVGLGEGWVEGWAILQECPEGLEEDWVEGWVEG